MNNYENCNGCLTNEIAKKRGGNCKASQIGKCPCKTCIIKCMCDSICLEMKLHVREINRDTKATVTYIEEKPKKVYYEK
ncbi:MAG: hypothetical protein PVG65_05780 [Candidatus Thorarchaeota archaeon]|jgi:hypothetical protein